MRSGRFKRLLWFLGTLLWLLATVFVARQLESVMSGSGRSDGEVRARLLSSEGKVLYRPVDSILWFSAEAGHEFYNNEVIAVPDESWGSLAILDSHKLRLRSGSMIQIGEQQTGSQNLPTVELFYGQVDVVGGYREPANTSSLQSLFDKPQLEQPLKITRGKESITVGPSAADQVDLVAERSKFFVKDVSGQVASAGKELAKSKGPMPRFALTKSTPRMGRLQASLVPLPVSLAPIPKAKPLPVIRPKPKKLAMLTPLTQPMPEVPDVPILPKGPKPLTVDDTPKMGGPALRSYLSADADGSRWPSLEIALTMPLDASDPDPRLPFVEIRGDGLLNAKLRVHGQPNLAKQTIRISGNEIAAVANGKFTTLSILTGVGRDTGADGVLSSQVASYRFSSLTKYAGKPVTLKLRSLRAHPGGPGSTLRENLDSPMPISVHLSDGRMLNSLLSQMRNGFRIESTPDLSTKDILRFVKDKRQILALEGHQIGRAGLTQLMKRFGAEFGYRGKLSDYLNLPMGGRNRLAFVSGYLADKESIKIISRNRLVNLTAKQLEEQPELIRPVTSTAEEAFSATATILIP